VAPGGYALRALTVRPLLGFAAANGFHPIADDDPPAAGDLLLVRPCPVQAHLMIACGAGGFVHAHAGLGRVVRQAGELAWPTTARWRLATKG
jgi:lipoprotein Spr